MSGISNIHAIAGNQSQPEQVFLATHAGLFLATSGGQASRVSESTDDFMALVRHPGDPSVFFASGHPSSGGNLGVIRSADGGKTWNKVSDGANGPVDFHTMTISPVDPNVMYGANKSLQVSNDGGQTWAIAGKAPADIFDIAASADDAGTLYAATRKGLHLSKDKGKTWRPAYLVLKPATMVDVSVDGRVRAFIYGSGLISAEEKTLNWKNISSSFQDRYIWRLVSNAGDTNRLYAFADTGALLISRDDGRKWTSFENNQWAAKEVVARGQALFEENCQACHGARGIGEKPDDMYARDNFGFVAPPLDNSAHGWHHSDQGIVETILNGSERNERMIPWKESLSRTEVENLVAYIKSLWSFRSIACQGPRHVSCMD